jgi:hypothetical protein
MKITQDSEQNTKCYVEELEIYSEEYAKKVKKERKKKHTQNTVEYLKINKRLEDSAKKHPKTRRFLTNPQSVQSPRR